VRKRILQFSLLLNVALIAVAGWRRSHEAPIPRTPRSEVGQPARYSLRRISDSSVQAAPTPWQSIEARDPAQLMANLRAIGCPEQTIRDIVTLRVCRDYRGRLIEAEAEAEQNRNYVRDATWRERHERWWEQTDLRNDMTTKLESLFGQSWESIRSSFLGRGGSEDQLETLSLEKRRQLRELEQRVQRSREELDQASLSAHVLDAEDRAHLRELEAQKRTELAKILSPQELEEYLYRHSAAADYVRKNLPEAKSEAEFRTMVKLADELEMMNPPIWLASLGDPSEQDAVARAFKERKATFEQGLKELLGEQLIAEQQAEEQARAEREQQQPQEEQKQQELTRMTELGTSMGLAPENISQFFNRFREMEPTLEKKLEEMEKNLTGTPEEKAKQMKMRRAVKIWSESRGVKIRGQAGQ
jgi:hypothetical protein